MRAVFLDLNGTLVEPVQVQHPCEHWIIPGALEAVQLLQQHGFACPVVTVQTRIAKGIFSADDFSHWFAALQQHFQQQGATLLGPYVCPHRWRDPCACKKPQPMLYQQAAAEHGLELVDAFVIGDTLADLEAAQALGCRSCLVCTGWGRKALEQHNAAASASYVATDLREAASWIVIQTAATNH